MMKHCRVKECGVELVVGENWTAGAKRNRTNKCRDCVSKYNVKYHAENRDVRNEWQSKYDSNNKGKTNARTAKRRAAKIERTPPWLTQQHFADIQSFYDWATYLEGPHDVDHVVPLQGKFVSGLHVPWNLEVLSRADHATKGNRFDV